MKQIARLTLLEHGLVTAALEIDSAFKAPASTSKKAAAAKAKQAASDNVEDGEVGESTDETIEELSTRLEEFVQSCLRAAKKGKQAHAGRDEYKESGTVFDVRRKVISQFIKSLSGKRRCEHCGAYVLSLPLLSIPVGLTVLFPQLRPPLPQGRSHQGYRVLPRCQAEGHPPRSRHQATECSPRRASRRRSERQGERKRDERRWRLVRLG